LKRLLLRLDPASSAESAVLDSAFHLCASDFHLWPISL